MDRIDGVIVGCDNQAGVPFELDWARQVVGQCASADVPCYVKQIRTGGKLVTKPSHFPAYLRHRRLPWRMPCVG